MPVARLHEIRRASPKAVSQAWSATVDDVRAGTLVVVGRVYTHNRSAIRTATHVPRAALVSPITYEEINSHNPHAARRHLCYVPAAPAKQRFGAHVTAVYTDAMAREGPYHPRHIIIGRRPQGATTETLHIGTTTIEAITHVDDAYMALVPMSWVATAYELPPAHPLLKPRLYRGDLS